MGYGVDLNFNVGKVGDSSYLGDYVYSEESEFNSEISLKKTIVEKQQFFDGGMQWKIKENAPAINKAIKDVYHRGGAAAPPPGKNTRFPY